MRSESREVRGVGTEPWAPSSKRLGGGKEQGRGQRDERGRKKTARGYGVLEPGGGRDQLSSRKTGSGVELWMWQ